MKYRLYLFIFLIPFVNSDDLDLGSDFSAGDTISASEFNSKFNMLEKTSRLVKDSDLIGTWNCKSVYKDQPDGTDSSQFTSGFLWYLDGNITFSESNQNPSITSPKSWPTDTGIIFGKENQEEAINETNGIYSIFAGYIFFLMGNNSSGNDELIEIELTSEDQFRLLTRENGNRMSVTASLCDKAS